MKNEKEIGNAFEKKLEGATKQAPPAMWEKINESLDHRDRRRKRAFWIWGAGILLIGLLGIYIITDLNDNPIDLVDTQQINNSNDKNSSTTPSEIDNNKEINPGETLNKKYIEGEISEGTTTKTDGQMVPKDDNEIEISEEKATQSTPKPKKTKERVIDEDYEVTKNYRYYNSKTKEDIITENKKLMDSVVQKNIQLQKSLDSITELNSKMEKKKDSM